eukprot:5004568-Amphidinium_carterae.1
MGEPSFLLQKISDATGPCACKFPAKQPSTCRALEVPSVPSCPSKLHILLVWSVTLPPRA